MRIIGEVDMDSLLLILQNKLDLENVVITIFLLAHLCHLILDKSFIEHIYQSL